MICKSPNLANACTEHNWLQPFSPFATGQSHPKCTCITLPRANNSQMKETSREATNQCLEMRDAKSWNRLALELLLMMSVKYSMNHSTLNRDNIKKVHLDKRLAKLVTIVRCSVTGIYENLQPTYRVLKSEWDTNSYETCSVLWKDDLLVGGPGKHP